MGEEISYGKGYNICDACGKMTRVTLQYLNGECVSAYCKACRPNEEDDNE